MSLLITVAMATLVEHSMSAWHAEGLDDIPKALKMVPVAFLLYIRLYGDRIGVYLGWDIIVCFCILYTGHIKIYSGYVEVHMKHAKVHTGHIKELDGSDQLGGYQAARLICLLSLPIWLASQMLSSSLGINTSIFKL